MNEFKAYRSARWEAQRDAREGRPIAAWADKQDQPTDTPIARAYREAYADKQRRIRGY